MRQSDGPDLVRERIYEEDTRWLEEQENERISEQAAQIGSQAVKETEAPKRSKSKKKV